MPSYYLNFDDKRHVRLAENAEEAINCIDEALDAMYESLQHTPEGTNHGIMLNNCMANLQNLKAKIDGESIPHQDPVCGACGEPSFLHDSTGNCPNM